jgi:transcriptional regulator with XRE-family HTH domain
LQITLKAARVNAGITQSKAADVVKTTTRTISSWESGKTLPDIASFKTLCKLYGVSMDAVSFLPIEST